jgi:hydrogenase expression/formation protein HypC
MCLAMPAKIVALSGCDAVVELNGVRLNANVAFIDEPQLGDYVLLHAGFAIRKWSAEDVAEYEAILASAAGDPAAEVEAGP